MPVKANIGLFTACKVEYYSNNQSSENCSPDGGKNGFTYFDQASAYINFANRSRILKKKKKKTHRIVSPTPRGKYGKY